MACGLFYVCHICFKLVDKTITANLACGRVSGLVTQPFRKRGSGGHATQIGQFDILAMSTLAICSHARLLICIANFRKCNQQSNVHRSRDYIHTYIVCILENEKIGTTHRWNEKHTKNFPLIAFKFKSAAFT